MELLFIVEIIINALAVMLSLRHARHLDCMETRYFNLQDNLYLLVLVLILDVIFTLCEMLFYW